LAYNVLKGAVDQVKFLGHEPGLLRIVGIGPIFQDDIDYEQPYNFLNVLYQVDSYPFKWTGMFDSLINKRYAVIEFVAHSRGGTVVDFGKNDFNDNDVLASGKITYNNAEEIGKRLLKTGMLADDCIIVLSSCNIGNFILNNKHSIPQSLANGSQRRVIASAGYTTGSWMERGYNPKKIIPDSIKTYIYFKSIPLPKIATNEKISEDYKSFYQHSSDPKIISYAVDSQKDTWYLFLPEKK